MRNRSVHPRPVAPRGGGARPCRPDRGSSLAIALILLAVIGSLPIRAADCIPYRARLRWVQRLAEPGPVTAVAAAGDTLLTAVAGRGVRVRVGNGLDPGTWWGDVSVDSVLALAVGNGHGWLRDVEGVRCFPLRPSPGDSVSAPVPLPVPSPTGGLAVLGDGAVVLTVWSGGSVLAALRPRGALAPAVTDSLSLPAGLAWLAASGDLAVAAGDGDTTLVVLDRDPDGRLRRRGAWRGDALARPALAADGRLLAAVADGALRLFDLTDPDRPRPLGEFPDTTAWRGLAWCGDRLLAAAADRLLVLAPTDGTPVPEGTFALGVTCLCGGRSFARGGDVAGSVQVLAAGSGAPVLPPAVPPPGGGPGPVVAAAAGTLLVTGGGPASWPRLRTAVLDATGTISWRADLPLPLRPVDLAGGPGLAAALLDSAHAGLLVTVTLRADGAASRAGTLRLTGEPRRVLLDDRRALVAMAARGGGTVDRLVLVDLSDPRVPRVVDRVGLPYVTWGLSAGEEHRFWLTGTDGAQWYVEWLDLSDPDHPALLESWLLSRRYRDLRPLPGTRWLAGLTVDGTLETVHRTPDGELVPSQGVWLPDTTATRLVVAGRWAVAGGRVPVVADLLDPAHPRVMGGTVAPGSPLVTTGSVAVPFRAGERVVAAAGTAGLARLPLPCGGAGIAPPPPDGGEERPPRPMAWLAPPFPNPANPGAAVTVHLPRPGPVRVLVVDLAGRVVRRLWTGPAPAGSLVLRWDGTDARGRSAPSGAYRVVLEAGGRRTARALTLVR